MITGVLLINKPQGISSFGVLRKLKHKLKDMYDMPLKKVKIGHAGTLDPQASGLLMVCLGHATKISSYLMRDDKVYTLDVVFGEARDTDDDEGQVISTSDRQPSLSECKKAMLDFIGTLDQLPPNFSAIKQGGKKLYEYARIGKEVQRKLRKVRVDSIEIESYIYPVLKIKVTCGKGTYMRALARDLGEALNIKAYAKNICRHQSGEFVLSKSQNFETMLEIESLDSYVMPLNEVLSFMPSIDDLTSQEVQSLSQGMFLQRKNFAEGEYCLLSDSNNIFALGEVNASGQLKIKRMLVDRV